MAKNDDCVFCRIAKGAMPAYVIYDDGRYMAFLDVYPNIIGQSLVIPKKHMDSYVFEASDKEIAGFMAAAKKVARLLERKLKVGRVNVVFEGLGVNHLHAKLYPAIGVDRKFATILAKETAYFQSYPGYVTTLLGPRAKDPELKEVHKRITGK